MLRSGRERDSEQRRPYGSAIDIDIDIDIYIDIDMDIDVDIWSGIGQPLTSDHLAQIADEKRARRFPSDRHNRISSHSCFPTKDLQWLIVSKGIIAYNYLQGHIT